MKEQSKRKKTINTAVFFTILIWLVTYLVVIKHKLLFGGMTATAWLVIVGLNLLVIGLSPFLVPVFELILKLTGKFGSLIFAIISTVIYYLILTPIAIFKRLSGSHAMAVKIDKDVESYYEDWEASPDVEKQS